MVKLVTSVICIHVHMSKYLHNTILVTFPMEVTIPSNSLCLEGYFSREVVFLRKSHFLGSHIYQKVSSPRVSFPRKSYLLGSHISRYISPKSPRGPCTYDVRTEGGEGVQELPNFADG